MDGREMRDYIPYQVEIVDIDRVTSDSYLISLQILDREVFRYRPGQFIMVSVFGLGECPISIASTPTRNTLQICIRRAGKITSGIMDSMIGDVLGVRGPCGNGFPLDFMKKDILIAGGGSGFATLRSLINFIADRREQFGNVAVAYGARTRQDLYFMQEYKGWQMAGIQVAVTVDVGDQGWTGNVGMVTSLLDRLEIPPGSAAICGPPVMINSVAARLMEKGFQLPDIFVSLERHMKCGVGKCEHCMIGPHHVCMEGPVFSYDRVRQYL
ncbi:MAG: Sulfhydrogenase 2 subunit gamma [Methanosaeta sp. PtaB.Bin039]|nr:MAG: Sulfhydrogenase 2 subunit gamma [Methanosaeta sp. PtaB.Bin039]OPY47162.1 MAG: Sulfhydrogenase 2 subunit gamma [Methanosaeta sp. PtaU1.Bin028]HOT06850.1 FAD/NAD(P)-binding protein [Methanotrichaceae archaeon]HQF16746.1 FAD/NAD(P)-binding protein [Methanotrichaceae archaeon]HQI91378.1 FAD/NAD(P)-binding protein [Methanotrichaceae archaeon]